jgi:N-acetylglucosamine-6-phosphate deacetylase
MGHAQIVELLAAEYGFVPRCSPTVQRSTARTKEQGVSDFALLSFLAAEATNDAGEAFKMFTIAPEMPNAEQVIKLLAKHNVVVSAGHSDCTFHQMIQAIGWGVTHLTHTFNAMRGVHHREPGMIAAALDSDKVWCSFICDLIHVHEWVLKFFIKAKGVERCSLITDSISATGMPEGEYTLGGQYVIVEGRAPRLIDGRLAGSVLTMIRGVRNLAEKVGIGLEGAIQMASENPAKVLGIYETKGSLEAGKDADICVLDSRFRVMKTFIEGKMVYNPEEGAD